MNDIVVAQDVGAVMQVIERAATFKRIKKELAKQKETSNVTTLRKAK